MWTALNAIVNVGQFVQVMLDIHQPRVGAVKYCSVPAHHTLPKIRATIKRRVSPT
jgi:hypothetical protein